MNQNDSSSTAGFVPASMLTRAELLDHARQPRNRGELPDADIVQREDNPLCGDVVTVHVALGSRHEAAGNGKERTTAHSLLPTAEQRIVQMSFTGSGCIISQAAASLLTEHAAGKSVVDIEAMGHADIEQLLGGQLSPSRVKCALLPLIALKRGLSARQQATGSRE